MKLHFKKKLSLIMTILLLLTCIPNLYADPFSDVQKHWAKDVIQDWVEMKYIKSYDNGLFLPDVAITRMDFILMINKMYGFTAEASIDFRDLSPSEVNYAEIKKAVAAGYINGFPDKTIKATQSLTRAEAAVIVTRLEKYSMNEAGAKVFKDWNKAFKGSAGAIGAAVQAGLFKGNVDGTFRPNNKLTRAEAITVTSRLGVSKTGIYTVAGTFGPASGSVVMNKTIMVKADKTVLQNMVIKGDLIIAESLGEGEVSLNNVIVEGTTYIKGGGANSVKINGGGYGKVFVMKQADTPVRLLVVNVKNLDVVIPQEAGGGQIVLEGVFNSVSVLAPKVSLSTQGNTTINEIKFDKLALEVKVNLGSGTVVMRLVTEVVLTVLGQGRIVVADVRVTGVTFERLPESGVGSSTSGTTGGGSTSGGSGSTTTPVPISDFAKASNTTTSASFTWSAATGATSVTIQQSPTGANTWTNSTHGALTATSTTGTAINLTGGMAYDFRLVVVGGEKAGTSNIVSNVMTVIPIANFAYASKTTTSASFTWSPATGATSVKIQQSPKNANTWTDSSHGTLSASSTTGTAIDLLAGTSYDFRLVVVGGENAGTSNVVSNITTEAFITDFAVASKTTTTAALTWTVATTGTSIKIQQALTGSGNWVDSTHGALTIASTNATVSGLTPGLAYDFRLVIVGGPEAGYSNVIINVVMPTS